MADVKNIILDSSVDALENVISPFIEEQFPAFIKADHHKLVLFIKSYYEWLEKQGNAGYVLSKLDTVGDIDNNAEEFYDHFKNTYMESFPELLAVNASGESPNKKTLLKKIREFYGNKGTESAYKFLFRLLYDSDLEIYYPKEDILKVSSGVWVEPKSIKLTSSSDSGIFEMVNGTITQYSPSDSSVVVASAVVETVVRYYFDGLPVTEVFMRNISGVFLPNEDVVISNESLSYTEKTYSVLGEFFIEVGGTGYSVGDTLFVVSDGTGFLAKVGVVGLAGSIKRISIENSGVNYFSTVEAVVISSTGENTNSRVFLRPTAITSYPGYFSSNRGKISSNKKIQDGHYYQEFSYKLRSSVSFDRYFSVLKSLTHPTGMRMFGSILMQSNLSDISVEGFSQYATFNTPLIGEYSPYRLESVLDLRNNGAVTTGYTSGVGDLSWRGLSGARLGGTNGDDTSIIQITNSLVVDTAAGAFSDQNYADNVDLSWKCPNTNHSVLIGLDIVASPLSYQWASLDYAWQMFGSYAIPYINGVKQVIPNASTLNPHQSYLPYSMQRYADDVFSIRYRNQKIGWYRQRSGEDHVLILEADRHTTHTEGTTLSVRISGTGLSTLTNIKFRKFTFNQGATGDLYPAGYNGYISNSSVENSGITSSVGTEYVGISGGYTYAIVPENGTVVHNPLGAPMGSSAAWKSGNEQSSNVAGLSGMILWLKPENIVAIGGGSAAGASLGVWTDASPQQNHGVLPTWDRWNDTLLYARKTSNNGWDNSLWNTNHADVVEWRIGNYGPPVSGISYTVSPNNLMMVGFWAAGCCGGLTQGGNTGADGPLGTGGNNIPSLGGYVRLDAAWYLFTNDSTGIASPLFYENGRGVSANATAITALPSTYHSNTVFGICFDKINNKVNGYIDGVVYVSQIGIPAGTTFYIDSSIFGACANVEILKAEYNGIPISPSGWTSTSGVTFTIITGNTMAFLAPTIVKNDTATGRDGVRFNGQLIRSPYMLWNGPTGTSNTLRSNPELNFISGSSAEGILKGSHFYLTRGLSLSVDMDAFVVCRSNVDSYYQGRWFVGSHRKFQGNTYDILFGNASYNVPDRTASIANNESYYRSAVISNVSGATAFAYDGDDGLVSFRPRGPNSTGINKVLAYDPHVSLFHVGTSIGEWSRDENFTIESFFNGDASRNYSPSTGRYVSTVTSPYKIEQPGFTSDHLLEIGRFGTAPRDGTGTLAGKNWLAETLTYQGDGSLVHIGEVTNYAQKYQGKRTYRIKTGTSGNMYLQSDNDFSTITGYNTPSKDWTFSAYLKREDGGVISTAGGVIGGPTLGSPFYQGNATVTSVGGNWYHLKRSLVGQTLSGLYPNGVTLSLVGFYGLSAGYTYDVSGAVVEKYPVYAPVGSTAWNASVNADTPYGFNGIINEIIVFNRKLKENERQTVYGYLSGKYSLSNALPNSFGSLSRPGAQRVGDQFWEIKHHPNTTSLTSVTLHSSVDTLVKPSLWTGGTGDVTGFSSSLNGPVGESVRLLDYDPWGKTSVVWQAQSDGIDGSTADNIQTGADGGWNGVSFTIDNTKMYRFCVWSKVVRDTVAVIYHGLGGSPILIAGSGSVVGSVDTNPYFSGRTTNMMSAPPRYPLNEWVLEVGFVYPHTYGVTGAVHPDSGAYTISRGANSKLFSDFYGQHKWSPTQNTASQRVYLFYENSAPPTSIIQFSEPRVEVVDGTEPSIADLLRDYPVENRVIPRKINFGNIRIGDFINAPTATYNTIGYEQANGVGLTQDTYTGL